MNAAIPLACFIFGLAFALSMLVAVMIKVIYLTVRHFSTAKEDRR